jgi:outer membrane protein OmpA-like peptidoglycan-associated protein
MAMLLKHALRFVRPMALPAVALGNLLWLNVALAPVVFADESRTAGSTSAPAAHVPEPEAVLARESEHDSQSVDPAGMEPQVEAHVELETDDLQQPSGRCDTDDRYQPIGHLAFDSDRHDLGQAAIAKLGALVESDSLQAHRRSLWVDGHSDHRGRAEHNQLLSRRRAEAVADALVERGVPRPTIVLRSFGESSPMAPASEAWKNRQATICVSKREL